MYLAFFNKKRTIRLCKKQFLKKVKINQDVQNNDLTSMEIPSNVKIISAHAFVNNNLTSVEIPNSVEYIGHNAFCDK